MPLDRSWSMVPRVSPDGGDARRDQLARQHRVHVGAGHREARRAEVVEGVPERVHPAVLDEGDGARARHRQVAPHEAHAHRVAGLEGRVGLRRRPPRHRPAHDRGEAGGAEHRRDAVERGRGETAQGEGGGDGAQADPVRRPRAGRQPRRGDVAGPRREGLRTREAGRQQAGQRVGGQGQGQLGRGARGPGLSRRIVAQHLPDGRDAGDGLLRERAQRVGNGADEPPVDVHRAAAHALNHPARGQGAAVEPGEDEVAARSERVLEHADDLGRELAPPRPLEDGEARAPHAWPHLLDRHGDGGRGQRRDQAPGREGEREERPVRIHGR